MNDNNWLFDGQPIRFSEDGRLLDGQHRLSAVIKSNSTQQFLIIKGIKSNSFKVMDTGRNRGGADVFHINGYQYSTALASVAKFILNFKSGKVSGDGAGKVSNTDMLDWADKNAGIIEIISKADKMRVDFSNVMPITQIASFYYLFSEKCY